MDEKHSAHGLTPWHGTTIVGVKKNDKIVVAGDGQVSMGNTVMKPNARKVRRIGDGKVVAGFAGATADAFTLFERLERKLEQYSGQLMRAAGIVTCRQRPGTASGIVFVTLEDETGLANIVVHSRLVERQRRELLGARLLGVLGQVQREGQVVHLVAKRLVDLSSLLGRLPTSSRNFH